MRRRALGFVFAVLFALCAASPAGAARADARVDATALYNAGTDALARGDLGPAVTLLLAAHRIDPRARDIRTNLAIARARVEEAQGSGERGSPSPPSSLALAPREAWSLAAALALAGALLAWIAALRARSSRLFLSGSALLAAGVLLSGGLALRAREEAVHPQAVVVAPVLDVGPAPDERPLPPYLLGAGEEVRLGFSRGDLVQVRVGGNAIGWTRRSGLWRVADAPQYTEKSGSR